MYRIRVIITSWVAIDHPVYYFYVPINCYIYMMFNNYMSIKIIDFDVLNKNV